MDKIFHYQTPDFRNFRIFMSQKPRVISVPSWYQWSCEAIWGHRKVKLCLFILCIKEFWTDFCVKYTCNGEFLHKTGQKWFVEIYWLPYESYHMTHILSTITLCIQMLRAHLVWTKQWIIFRNGPIIIPIDLDL